MTNVCTRMMILDMRSAISKVSKEGKTGDYNYNEFITVVCINLSISKAKQTTLTFSKGSLF